MDSDGSTLSCNLYNTHTANQANQIATDPTDEYSRHCSQPTQRTTRRCPKQRAFRQHSCSQCPHQVRRGLELVVWLFALQRPSRRCVPRIPVCFRYLPLL